MTAYAIAHLSNVDLGADIVEYLRRIDATLAPFGGRFIVHGGRQMVAEGPADGVIVVIEFPDYEAAQGWYASPAYQKILPLRRNNADNIDMLAERCADDHVATDVLPRELLES
ncbi:DUF1330 domain-containing protein [Nocardia pseudobrasiliensis]|uniref:Uncharacterized protein (DUF1330 family) n=2 Tax=Nocardia pseudobrasiliensis TaxID=45979 RepID=A0A370I836_9NOCA|nr:DUF1330 domain-containing protein [Nocardia pseudobrasiliensis]RDI66887.1 uncharacterized protein (DUF1330 family) [Nocardia pseudobrasiliensis]